MHVPLVFAHYYREFWHQEMSDFILMDHVS